MKTAIIFHGMPEDHEYQGNESKMHWIPWLRKKLEAHGFTVHAPELPKAVQPEYKEWLSVFQGLPGSESEDVMLIGHSAGAGFFVRYLSENSAKVGPVFLVAPWLDPRKHLEDDFFLFTLDRQLMAKTKGITALVSLDDGQEVLESVQYLIDNVPGIKLKEFSDKGHFIEGDMGTEEFPELLEEILKQVGGKI